MWMAFLVLHLSRLAKNVTLALKILLYTDFFTFGSPSSCPEV